MRRPGRSARRATGTRARRARGHPRTRGTANRPTDRGVQGATPVPACKSAERHQSAPAESARKSAEATDSRIARDPPPTLPDVVHGPRGRWRMRRIASLPTLSRDAARTRFTAAGATERWLGHAHELSLDARATYLLVEALLASILVPALLGGEVGDGYADDQRAAHAASPPNDRAP